MRVMDTFARSAILLSLLTLVALQIYILLCKRDDVTWRELARAKLRVLLEPEKYLKPGRAGGIRILMLVFLLIAISAWVGVWFMRGN